MANYQIISDSSCDIPATLLQTLDIGIVSYYATFDTVQYYKELSEITADVFYEKIKEQNVYPKTSLPPIQDYIDVFEPYLQAGKDILCICLTSKFSGSFQSANNAKQILMETYPDRRIEILDSICVTGTQGLLVWQACQMRDDGYDLDTLLDALHKQKQTAKINFTVENLDFLQHGGRVGKAAAFAGAILNIKPVIVMRDGELFPESKVRGHKKALKTILDMTVQEIGTKKQDYHLCVIRGEQEKEADAQMLISTLQADGFSVEPTPWHIGITIGTHAGPTAVGICYIKSYEK